MPIRWRHQACVPSKQVLELDPNFLNLAQRRISQPTPAKVLLSSSMGCYPCVKPKTGQCRLLRCYNPKTAGPRILISITAKYQVHSATTFFSLFLVEESEYKYISSRWTVLKQCSVVWVGYTFYLLQTLY